MQSLHWFHTEGASPTVFQVHILWPETVGGACRQFSLGTLVSSKGRFNGRLSNLEPKLSFKMSLGEIEGWADAPATTNPEKRKKSTFF